MKIILDFRASFSAFALERCLTNIDSRGVERILEMDRVVLLNHLDAGTAVFCDLIDVGAFHQAHTDVGVAQAVSRARFAVAVEF